jgi:hypothetical protein
MITLLRIIIIIIILEKNRFGRHIKYVSMYYGTIRASNNVAFLLNVPQCNKSMQIRLVPGGSMC